MNLWVTENQTPDLRIGFRINEVLHLEKSEFQEIAVYDTREFGRLLMLDDVVMTTERDEFVYHEMMAHVAISAHPRPRRVLVVGGGDGGVVREALRHPVEEVHLAEIDGRVIAVCREYFPAIACGLDDPRVKVCVTDGIAHVREYENYYDVIIVDSTDPVGPAVGLFQEDFYRSIHRALTADGLFAAQTESPFLHGELIRGIHRVLRGIFPAVHLCLAVIPTYPAGLWTITLGSKGPDPRLPAGRPAPEGTKYYSPDVHRAAFVLPPFVRALVEG